MPERNYEIVEKALNCPVTRRQVLKSLVAAGVLVAVPGGFMKAATSSEKINYDEIIYDGPYETFRNACPRNCYDTCSIVTYEKMVPCNLWRGLRSRPLPLVACA
jgi:hypothetical protein